MESVPKRSSKVRSTCSQLKILVDFMALNRRFAYGDASGKKSYAAKWQGLAELLAKHGPPKTVDQWKTSWKDLKKNARRHRNKTSSEKKGGAPETNELHERVLSILGYEEAFSECPTNYFETSFDESFETREKDDYFQNVFLCKKDDSPDDYLEPETKKRPEDVFSTITRSFVNLVKKGACPLSLFDEVMFRDVIDLIPMTRGEKDRISSEYIQTFIQNDTGCCLDQDTDVDTTMDNTEDAADEIDVLGGHTPLLIKTEVETVLCTCGKDFDGTMTSHTVDCTAADTTFMKFFEVSPDKATCHICNGTVACADRDTLKQHLQTEHPDTLFIVHNKEEDRGATSNEDSSNDHRFLEDNFSDAGTSTGSTEKRRKKSKLPLLFSGPMTREKIEAGLQRLKSLDYFGPYVVSLLKSIPRDKCVKFQIEMVERLLQEQAAAG